jgi:hypothetical protein
MREKRNPYLIWWENLMDRERRVGNLRVCAMIILNLYLICEIKRKIFETGWEDVELIHLA